MEESTNVERFSFKSLNLVYNNKIVLLGNFCFLYIYNNKLSVFYFYFGG